MFQPRGSKGLNDFDVNNFKNGRRKYNFEHFIQFNWFLEELCHPSPCGPNTECTVINDVPTCSCLPGYHGQPLTGCKHECDSDRDCSGNQLCQNFKCAHSCQQGSCGAGALCEVFNHRPTCRCPEVISCYYAHMQFHGRLIRITKAIRTSPAALNV